MALLLLLLRVIALHGGRQNGQEERSEVVVLIIALFLCITTTTAIPTSIREIFFNLVHRDGCLQASFGNATAGVVLVWADAVDELLVVLGCGGEVAVDCHRNSQNLPDLT